MKLIYGISRWTNANSNKRTHIPNEHGQPACIRSPHPFRQHTYEATEGDAPTCYRCLKLLKANRQTENMCCPHLQINQCASSTNHNHMACGARYEAGEGLPTNQEVAEVCLGNFENCKYYPLERVVVEGSAGHEN